MIVPHLKLLIFFLSNIPFNMRFLSALTIGLASLLQAALADSSTYSCSEKFAVNGYYFDLTSLSADFNISSIEETPPTVTRKDLLLNICKPYTKPPSIAAEDFCTENSWVCEIVTNIKASATAAPERVVQVIPWVKAAPAPVLTLLDGGVGLNALFSGSSYRSNDLKANLTLLCDKDASPGKPTAVTAGGKGGDGQILQVEWKSAAACGQKAPSGVKEGGKEGMSGFGLFMLLLWISVFCYVILGTAYK
jgi:hypothetical protein